MCGAFEWRKEVPSSGGMQTPATRPSETRRVGWTPAPSILTHYLHEQPIEVGFHKKVFPLVIHNSRKMILPVTNVQIFILF